MSESDDIVNVRKTLLRKLKHQFFSNKCDEYSNILSTLKRTIKDRESKSMLIISPHSFNTMAVIKEALVELNGDTDCTVIPLLPLYHSTCSQIYKRLSEWVSPKAFKSIFDFIEAYSFEKDAKIARPLVFILDEFHKFCDREKEDFVYYLLDAIESAEVPICVVCLTNHVGITELLTRNVKSRLNTCNKVVLYQKNTLDDFKNIIRNSLKVEESKKGRSNWNARIDKLVTNRKFHEVVEKIHFQSTSLRLLQNILIRCICNLDEDHNDITINDLNTAFDNFKAYSKISYLESLSILELCLAIVMYHITDIYEEPFNFEMVFQRYAKFARGNSANVPQISKYVAFTTFEAIRPHLLSPLTNMGSAQKEFIMYRFLATKDEMQYVIRNHGGLSAEIKQWAESSLAE